MSRLSSEWTAAMKCPTDHPEIRQLYANGGGVAQEWLIDQIVKFCSAYGVRDGLITLADIKSVAAGKISRPTLTKYIRDLLKCGALQRTGGQPFHSPIAERICGSFTGRGNKLVKNCKNSFTPENADIKTETACETQNKLPRPVPDLEQDLNTKHKADEPVAASAFIPKRVDTVAAEAKAASEPLATDPVPVSEPGVDLEMKKQVARQAGSGEKQGRSADTFMSVAMAMSKMSLQDFMSLQAVDLDDLDTEAILKRDREDAALLANTSPPARRAPAKAEKDLLPAKSPEAVPDAFELQQAPRTTQPLAKSIIRVTLSQLAEAVPDYTFGDREVNALSKWPVTEAQLVNLKNAAVAQRRKGKVEKVGAYLYGAVRRASLGLLPARPQAAEAH